MYKLVMLIEPPEDSQAFEDQWPQFLHLVEALPGLRREASSRVSHFLYGRVPYAQVHELFFDSYPAAEAALSSPVGQQAGQLLQHMTGGRLSLFFADHREDDLDNILRHRAASPDQLPGPAFAGLQEPDAAA